MRADGDSWERYLDAARPGAPRAVIFDLGRVLIDIDLGRGLLGRLAAAEGEPPETVMARVSRDDFFRRLCAGRLTPENFHAEACARFGLALPYGEFVRLWCDIFLPMPGMEALLVETAARVRVGLLSDTDPLHWAWLRDRLPALARIPSPTLSFVIGAAKPDPVMYAAAARSVGAAPADCLYIDDLEANVRGALDAGMRAVRFTGAAALRAELEAAGVLGPSR